MWGGMNFFNMIKNAIQLFFLKKLDFHAFNSKINISIFSIITIGPLTGIDPSTPTKTLSKNPSFITYIVNIVIHGVLPTLSAFITITALLGLWFKRGHRWDGEGSLLNLIAASWLVSDSLIAILVALGISRLLIIPLLIYSIIVGVNALSNAIPKASRAYCLSGIVLTFLPGFLAAAAVSSVSLFFLHVIGWSPH